MNRFLCTKKEIRKYSTIAREETLPLVKNLINCCLNQGDIWGNEVHTHVLSCNDLVAEEPIYYVSFMNCFWFQKNTSDRSSGQAIDPTMMRNFEKVCQWLEEEGDGELYTLAEIHGIMQELRVVNVIPKSILKKN